MFYPRLLSQPSIKAILIGVGGTGSALAPNLAKLFDVLSVRLNKEFSLTLMDGDRVEQKNVIRQNFMPQDVGLNKAYAVARRITPTVQRTKIESVQDYLTKEYLIKLQTYNVIISCVDSTETRKLLSYLKNPHQLIVDCGNDRESGQVVAGNAGVGKEECKSLPTDILPSPYKLFPELTRKKRKRRKLSCADRIDVGEQELYANVMTATLALILIQQILMGECSVAGYRFYKGQTYPIPIQVEQELCKTQV